MEVQDHASLKEHDLDRFVEREVTDPEDEVARTKVQKGHGESKGGDEACDHLQTHLGLRNSLVCVKFISEEIHFLFVYFTGFRVSGTC